MGTIGAVAYRGQTFLLVSSDGDPAGLAWRPLPAGTGQWRAAGLVAPDGGVDAGINEAGLAFAMIGEDAETGGLRQGAIRALADASSLNEAVPLAEEHLAAATSGCLGLADAAGVALVEVGESGPRVEVAEKGFLARSCPVPEEAVEEGTALAGIRCERMTAFLEQLYAWLPTLDEDDVAARCRAVLRQEPILNPQTRVSLLVDLADRRVDLAIGDGHWQVERLWARDRPTCL